VCSSVAARQTEIVPSPRFDRAAPAVRDRVLEAVQAVAERDGLERVSLQQVIADASLSRSAGYTYFDGRDELVDWAIDETVRRAASAVGAWTGADDVAELWSTVADAGRRLREHVHARPARGVLLAAASTPRRDGVPRPQPTAWISDAYRNAERLCLVAALDELELAEPGSVADGDLELVLARIWGSPAPRSRNR